MVNQMASTSTSAPAPFASKVRANHSLVHPIYEDLKKLSDNGIDKRKIPNDHCQVVIPVPDIIKIVHKGSFIIKIEDVFEIIASITPNNPPCLGIVIKTLSLIHPFLDFDLCVKDMNVDRNVFALDIIKQITNIFKTPNIVWGYSVRDGGKTGGVHIFNCTHNLKPYNYGNFVKFVKSKIVFDEAVWKLDAPNTVCLPGCGKQPDVSFVYHCESGFEPCIICSCDECQPLRFGKVESDGAAEKGEGISSYVKRTNVGWATLREVAKRSLGDNCTEENAILYVNCFPESDNDALYSAAKKIVSELNCKNQGMMAILIANMFQKPDHVLPMHSDNMTLSEEAEEAISKAIANRDNLMVANLFALLFPTHRINDKTLVYKNYSWQVQEPTFLEFALPYIKSLFPLSDSYNPFTLVKSNHCVNFWNFKKVIEQYKTSGMSRRTVCTSDNYIFEPKYKQFVHTSLLIPVMTEKLNVERKAIHDLISNTDINESVNAILDNSCEVLHGNMSFDELFQGHDHNIALCMYLLLTFFCFKVPKIKRFLILFKRILFGSTKKIILLVGPSADNGKTTLMTVLHGAFGNASGYFNVSELEVKPTNSDTSPDFNKNCEKKLVFTDEAGGVKIDTKKITLLTGGGQASSRALYSDTVTRQCNSNSVLAGNSLPSMEYEKREILKRLVLFDADAVFEEQYFLTEREMWSEAQSFEDFVFPKLELDVQKMSLGLLCILLYIEYFPGAHDIKEKVMIEEFTHNNIQLNCPGEMIADDDMQRRCNEASKNLAEGGYVLYLKVRKFYQKSISQNCFMGMKLKDL